jgi:hypothetical protein
VLNFCWEFSRPTTAAIKHQHRHRRLRHRNRKTPAKNIVTLRLQIKCIIRTGGQDAHERIQSVGGTFNGSYGEQRWKHIETFAILCIKVGTYSYYVVNNEGQEVDVIIAASQGGHEYLKTTADGEQPDNLLNLPECPD